MPKAELRIAENFIDDLSRIYSKRVLQRIKAALSMLEDNPEIGSPLVRVSLVEAFGDGICTYAISTFVLVYRFDGAYVDILALVYGPRIV